MPSPLRARIIGTGSKRVNFRDALRASVPPYLARTDLDNVAFLLHFHRLFATVTGCCLDHNMSHPHNRRSTQLSPWLGVLIAGLFFSLALGCSSTPDPSPSPKGSFSGVDEHIFLDESIERNYDPHVIMKRAEAFFERMNYPEAIVEYQHFLDMHRAHVLAPYAQFKLGESHHKMAKTIDRDPLPIQKALEAYRRLLVSYPGSKFEIDALVKIRECDNWLGEVDLFVGRFYLRQEAYLAAAHRFEHILESDRELDMSPDALYYLAVAYKGLGADEWAREKLIMLADRYPRHGHAEEADALLAALGGAPRTVAVAQQFHEQPAPANVTQASQNGGVSSERHPAGFSHMNGANGAAPTLTAPRIEPAAIRSSRAPAPAPAPITIETCRLGDWC